MTTQASKAAIAGMRNDYGQDARIQAATAGIGLDHALKRLFETVEFSEDRHFHVVDLGSADGINSFAVLEKLLTQVKTIRPEIRQCTVTHVDLPSADFSGLMQNVYHHPDSYLDKLQSIELDIQPNFVPGSFYQRYAGPRSADVVFSTTALHYASVIAGPVSNHVDPLLAEGVEREPWEKLSRRDLNSALLGVSNALKPGGKFWAVAPARRSDASGAPILHWNRELWTLMAEEFTRLVDTGEIERSDWEAFVIPVHQRELGEWTKWFALNAKQMRLEYAELVTVPNEYLAGYLDDHRDAWRFATDYCEYIRAWGDRIVSELIPDQSRRDEFFQRLWQVFAAEPERFADDNLSISIGASRR